jgi:predicted phage tail component-like protein
LPAQRKYTLEVPGFDGEVDFGIGSYGTRIITCEIYFEGDFSFLRANEDNIIAWLSSINGQPKQLIFGDTPNKYYLAKIYSAFDFTNSPDHHIGTVQFECNPPWAYLNGVALSPANILWNTMAMIGTEYFQDLIANGNIKFTIGGSLPITAQIMLIGNIQSGLTLTYGSQVWKYNANLLYDGILIDCTAQTVTRMSDGANLFPNVDGVDYAYFTLATGQQQISVAGVVGAFPNDLMIIIKGVPQIG